MSDSDRISLAYAKETTFAATPTGQLTDIRITGESLAQATSIAESSEIRSDRQVADARRVSYSAAGGINFELTSGTFDDWLASALLSAGWSTPVTSISSAATISFAAVDNSVSDSASGLIGYAANQWIEVTGSVSNDGIYKISSVTAGKIIVIGGTFVDEAVGASVSITQGAQIVNGTTLDSYSIERVYEDLTNTYSIFTGMCLDKLNVDVKAGSIITGSFDFMGVQEASATATAGTGTNVAAPTTSVINATDDVFAILENSTSYSATEISFALTNNLRDRAQIGSGGPVSVGAGQAGLTGSLQAYFSSSAIMDKYLNYTDTSLAFIVKDISANYYVFDIPRVNFSDGKRVAGGKNTDIIADMNFVAKRNSTEGITLRIAKM